MAIERLKPIERLMRPRSVAIVGVSPEPGSIGGLVLRNLERWKYRGNIHLVSRGRRQIEGRACVASIDDLPEDIDVAVLSVPQAGVIDAVAACGRRKIGTAMIFASGFAEVDDAGRENQRKLIETARAGGVRLVGPNCMGLANHSGGVPLTFEILTSEPSGGQAGVAVVAQSGALSAMIRNAFLGKGLAVTHIISSGNEADLSTEDYLAFLLDDPPTKAIALLMEQVRRPQDFLALARQARSRGKPIVLMHPGRTDRARASALTHTGSLTGNHAVMTTLLRHEAVVVVDTLDELYDATDILVRFPPPTAGIGVITSSGAAKGFALDFCADHDIDVAKPAPQTLSALKEALPAFAPVDNPVDVTAQVVREPAIWTKAAAALLADPGVGSLCVPMVPGSAQQARDKAGALLPPILAAGKPAIIVAMGDGYPLPPEYEEFTQQGIPVWRSPERALRALGHATAYGRALAAAPGKTPLPNIAGSRWPPGVLPEYRAKEILVKAGLAVPRGALAQDAPAAIEIAARVGYPVALKAQSSKLAHKTEAGGVVLDIADATQLSALVVRMAADMNARGIKLDGVLVEAMVKPGVELIVGAKRDPDWGAVMLVGLGGIWTEALADIVLLPPDLPAGAIAEAIGRLKGAALLRGTRGAPPCDIGAVADAVARVGALIRARPEIAEIDINPLVAHLQGAVALDALIVVAP